MGLALGLGSMAAGGTLGKGMAPVWAEGWLGASTVAPLQLARAKPIANPSNRPPAENNRTCRPTADRTREPMEKRSSMECQQQNSRKNRAQNALYYALLIDPDQVV
jgi:hypothetical protein